MSGHPGAPYPTIFPRPAILRFVDNVNGARGRPVQSRKDESRWPAAGSVAHSAPVLGTEERHRLDAAAGRALRVYPGPVGELIHREIRAFLDFGFRFEGGGLAGRLAEQMLASDATTPMSSATSSAAP